MTTHQVIQIDLGRQDVHVTSGGMGPRGLKGDKGDKGDEGPPGETQVIGGMSPLIYDPTGVEQDAFVLDHKTGSLDLGTFL